MRIVVALGGTALRRPGQPLTVESRRAAVAAACAALAPVAEAHELVISHGAGPQAGQLSLQAPLHDAAAAHTVDGLDAQSEWAIDYLIEQELGNLLPAEAPVVTVLTTSEVDPDDPAFADPTAFVGPGHRAGRARRIARERGWVFRQDGDAWRRVVPAPQPRRIVQTRPVEWLLARGCVVICAGGGGMPTMSPRGVRTTVGAEAVVDKDRASAVLAQDLGADLLLLAGDVDAVYLDWGTPHQQAIACAHPDALDAASFPAGSMRPKIEAAAQFARTSGRSAVIGSLAQLAAILAGEEGTRVTVQVDGLQLR
ncbi:carbamate kinase [Blastococcus sp. URHD0036]|uniref:carbamate kinase n=1 Tax=Blastococcus sp. URHD0036 TaxID=1380356 RepID=UPI0004967468|nr:carbamate kinase [Blastococcus sp. URHD0036]